MNAAALSTWLREFHWLRPGWLWALLPLALVVFLLWRQRRNGGDWRDIIAPELLPHLLRGRHSRPGSGRWLLLGCGWLLAVLALAGPSWERLPQPVVQRDHAVVAILDLSLSMYAEDIPPSRLVRARHKLLSLLEQQREGLIGLVAYAGDAHVVAPLTDDRGTIANLIPALSPDIMPLPGSDAAAAVEQAVALVRRHGLTRAQLLLITDGVDARAAATIARRLPSEMRLSVLGVGTTTGAPVAQAEGYLKDAAGNIVVARLQRQPLRELAAAAGGQYRDIQLDDSDLRELVDSAASLTAERRELAEERHYDSWRDRAPWLAVLLLPIAAAGFRRGWLVALAGLALLPGGEVQALEWRDLWQRPDQQAARQLQQNQPEAAAELFQDPAWRGSALYRAEDYAAAAEAFGQLDSANAHYNRGNALARAGKLEDALAAYDAALAQQPGLQDAIDNRQLVQDLLEQQQSQQSQQQSQQQSSDQQDADSSAGDDPSQSAEAQDGDDPSNQDAAEAGEPSPGNGDHDDGVDDPGVHNNGDQRPEGADSQSQAGAPEHGPDSAPEQQPATPDSQGEPDDADAGADPAHDGMDTDAASGDTEPASPQSEQDGETSGGTPAHESDAETEADPVTERWLRQIPDDPAGLLRRKFDYESRRRAAQGERPSEDAPQW